MPWGSLSGAQQILVRLYMTGGPQYEAQMVKAGLATRAMSRDVVALDKTLTGATRKTWLFNQALFTARRFAFYGTLGIVGATAALFKMGFQFDATKQQAMVAFSGLLGGSRAANREINTLYAIAAKTPFEFPDIMVGARRLQEFTNNIKTTNMVVNDIANSLSAAGLTSGQYFQRASLALAHMFAIGRLTGQVLYQLARDNIPMQKALQVQFHATGEEIRKAVSGGLIDANTAAKALHDYILSNRGLRDAAVRQSLRTLPGAWSTFKDILRLGAGHAEEQQFNKLTKMLIDVDKALLPLIKPGKPITLTLVATAIDKQLTPATHAIINSFMFLQGVLEGLVASFYVFVKVISFLLKPFDKLTAIFGHAHQTARALGWAVGVLTFAFLFQKVVLGGLYTATATYLGLMKIVRGMQIATAILMGRQTATLTRQGFVLGTGSGTGLIGRWKSYSRATKEVWDSERRMFTTVKANEGIMAKMGRTIFGLGGAGGAGALANPYVAIAAAILLIIGALVILYFKWKPFHDLVNRTFKWIWNHADQLSAALILGFGPIGMAVGGLLLIVKHLRQIINLIKEIGKAWNKLPPWMRHSISFAAGFSLKKGAQTALGAVTPPGARAAVSAAQGGGGFFGGAERFLTSQAKGMIPFYGPLSKVGGFFQMGGTVPGPLGSPQLVVAHGGEQVQPVGQAQWDKANNRPIHVALHLDRKVVATAVARANQDYAARR